MISVTLYLLFIFFIARSILLLLIPRRFRSKKDLVGQTVLITGAGSGLGRQLAIELSRFSTRLALLDINKKSLQETLELLNPSSSVFIYECDIADRKNVYKTFEDVKRDVGDVDILINNAGIVQGRYLLDMDDERIVKTFEVNTLAHFWFYVTFPWQDEKILLRKTAQYLGMSSKGKSLQMCKAALPSMMNRNYGHIVCVSSLVGYMGAPKLTDYCASKFAAIGFAESLECELKIKKLDGIKITVACPSHINTGLFDGVKIRFSPALTPNYVAKEIVFGIQTNMETVILPQYLNIFLMIKFMLPRWLLHKIYELTGNARAMDNFKGRVCKNTTSNGFNQNGR